MLEIDLSNVSEQTKVKYIEFVKQVKKLLQKYEEQDLEGLQQVKSKIEDTRGNWDIGIRLKYGDNAEKEIPISLLLAYEYCLATERITNRRVKFEEMLDKLFDGVQKFRIGNPVQGVDDECLYGKSLDDQTAIPIMTKQYRIKMPAGAQHLDYVKDGKPTSAVFIYAKESIPNFAIDSNTGEPKSFETDGIDFQELLGEISLLTCLRQTVFHEWNHNAEKEMISPNEQAIPEEYESIDGKKYKNYETKSQYVSAQGIAIQEPTTYYYDSKERKYYYVDLAGNRQYDVNFELRINQLDKKYYISTRSI